MQIINSLTSFIEFLHFTFNDEISFVTSQSNFISSKNFEEVLTANNVEKSQPLFRPLSYHTTISQYHIASFITQEKQLFPAMIGSVFYGNNIVFAINSKSTIDSKLKMFFEEQNYEEALAQSKKFSGEFHLNEEFTNLYLREPFLQSFKKNKSIRKMLENIVFKSSDFQFFQEHLDEENYMKFISSLRFENFDIDPKFNIKSNIISLYDQLYSYALKNPKRGKVYLSRFIVGVNNNIEKKITKESLENIFTQEEIDKFSKHLNSIHSDSSISIKDSILSNYENQPCFIFSYYKFYLADLPRSMQAFIDKYHLEFIEAALGIHQYAITRPISSKYLNKAYICSPIYKSTTLISDKIFMSTFANIISNLVKIPGFYDNLKNDVNSHKIIQLNELFQSKMEMQNDITHEPQTSRKIVKF